MKKLFTSLFLLAAALGSVESSGAMGEVAANDFTLEQVGIFDASLKKSCADYEAAAQAYCNALQEGDTMGLHSLRLELALERMKIQQGRCNLFYSGPTWQLNKARLEQWEKSISRQIDRCRDFQFVSLAK